MKVVRLKFQWSWATPGRFTWKISREQPCESQRFKVTNTGKTSSNVFLSLQLTKTDVKFLPIKIASSKVSKNNVCISTIEITSKKVRGNNMDFSFIKITSKKYAKMTWKFVKNWSLTYRRNIHIESTWIRHSVSVGSVRKRLLHRYFSVNFENFLGKLFCRTLPSNHFSHDVVFFLFADQWGSQPKVNLFGGAMVN